MGIHILYTTWEKYFYFRKSISTEYSDICARDENLLMGEKEIGMYTVHDIPLSIERQMGSTKQHIFITNTIKSQNKMISYPKFHSAGFNFGKENLAIVGKYSDTNYKKKYGSGKKCSQLYLLVVPVNIWTFPAGRKNCAVFGISIKKRIFILISG